MNNKGADSIMPIATYCSTVLAWKGNYFRLPVAGTKVRRKPEQKSIFMCEF